MNTGVFTNMSLSDEKLIYIPQPNQMYLISILQSSGQVLITSHDGQASFTKACIGFMCVCAEQRAVVVLWLAGKVHGCARGVFNV